ncbi:MAG: hypothetical protein AAF800_02200 [Planctomycetota bacterium]
MDHELPTPDLDPAPRLDDSGHYRIYRIRPDSAYADEWMGTKAKFWIELGDGRRWLFKFNRDRDRTRPGEGEPTGDDWAEGIAGELAKLLGLPCCVSYLAEYQDPRRGPRRGVALWDFTRIEVSAPDERRVWASFGPLEHGNQLLYQNDPDNYDPDIRRGQKKHTPDRVLNHLAGRDGPGKLLDTSVAAPLRLPGRDDHVSDRWNNADAIFVGYLLLDAWIGNTDRHHENWGVIDLASEPRDQRHDASRPHFFCLAPTYDHAASLGANLTDAERQERLTTKDRNRTLAAYLDRGRSAFYAEGDAPGKPLPMIEVFRRAAALEPEAARDWLDRLDAVGPDAWQTVLNRVPLSRMTDTARTFVDHFLTETRRRLLNLKITP